MGNGIAHVFAMKGYTVHLVDISQDALDRALATINKNLDRMVKKERISENDKADTLKKITTFTDLKTASTNADLIVEAATENVDLKLKIFAQIIQDLSLSLESSIRIFCKAFHRAFTFSSQSVAFWFPHVFSQIFCSRKSKKMSKDKIPDIP